MNTEWNCALEGVFSKTQLQKLRHGELRRGVRCSGVVCGRHSAQCTVTSPVCVRTSRVRPNGKCEKMELSDGCGLGAGPEGAVPFDSCARDKGCVVDVEHAPDCNC